MKLFCKPLRAMDTKGWGSKQRPGHFTYRRPTRVRDSHDWP